MAANVETMMFVGSEGLPWHGLGQSVESAQHAADAIINAGLAWTVRTEGIVTTSGLEIRDGRRCRAIVREDRNEVLGVTGSRYKPIQNVQAFDFLDSLAVSGVMKYHTAGSLGKGERIWILGKLDGEITIPKTNEVINKYILFSNSHDGTSAGRALLTPIRVVCQNTLSLAIGKAKRDGEPGIVIRHTGELRSKIEEAQRILGLSLRGYDDFEGQVRLAARTRISDAQRKAYFRSLFGPKPVANQEDGTADEVSTQTRKVLERLETLFQSGRGNDEKGVRGSVWAAYNAVTEQVDWHSGVRLQGAKKGDETAARSNRLASIWFGDGAKLKEKAWTLALETLKVPVGNN